MNIAELQRIKQWHVRHHEDHPVEYQLWDAMLTMWLMGWVGWLPTIAFHALWAMPLCMAAMAAPTLYVSWRLRQHRQHKLRCDWARVLN